MSAISKIEVMIETNDINNAGTDGYVYLGICGREFYLDSKNDDFERGSKFTYIIGSGANILNKNDNDPRNPPIDTDNLPDFSIPPQKSILDQFPVYIRFEPSGSSPAWNLLSVSVLVFVGRQLAADFQRAFFNATNDAVGLWLSQKSGKFCYIGSGLGTSAKRGKQLLKRKTRRKSK